MILNPITDSFAIYLLENNFTHLDAQAPAKLLCSLDSYCVVVQYLDKPRLSLQAASRPPTFEILHKFNVLCSQMYSCIIILNLLVLPRMHHISHELFSMVYTNALLSSSIKCALQSLTASPSSGNFVPFRL